MAQICLNEKDPEEFYRDFPKDKPANGKLEKVQLLDKSKRKLYRHFATVKAHRYYQFTMSLYKLWRYENGGDILEQKNNPKNKNQPDS